MTTDTHALARHLAWCRQRTLERLAAGERPLQLVSGLAADMRQHEDTRLHPALPLLVAARVAGGLRTVEQVESFVNQELQP